MTVTFSNQGFLQLENIAHKTYKVHEEKLKEVREPILAPIPEFINGDKLIPDETFVLIGFFKSKEHLNWINKSLLYNFRMDNNRGALKLNQETMNAKYLLLHSDGDEYSSVIYEIKKPEYRVTKKATLERLNYPNPRQNNYLLVKLNLCKDKEFKGVSWEFKKLKNYKSGRASAIPFTSSLSDLMSVTKKD